jgi:hypothetical protein
MIIYNNTVTSVFRSTNGSVIPSLENPGLPNLLHYYLLGAYVSVKHGISLGGTPLNRTRFNCEGRCIPGRTSYAKKPCLEKIFRLIQEMSKGG